MNIDERIFELDNLFSAASEDEVSWIAEQDDDFLDILGTESAEGVQLRRLDDGTLELRYVRFETEVGGGAIRDEEGLPRITLA